MWYICCNDFPKSKFFVEEISWNGKSYEKDGTPERKFKQVYTIWSKQVRELVRDNAL